MFVYFKINNSIFQATEIFYIIVCSIINIIYHNENSIEFIGTILGLFSFSWG